MSERQVDVTAYLDCVEQIAGVDLAESVVMRDMLEFIGYGVPGQIGVPEVVCEHGRHGDIGDGEPQAVEAWYRCPFCRAEV